MVPCQRCTVVLFDFERGQAELIAGYSGGAQLGATSLPLAEFPPAEVLQRGSVRYVEDLAAIEDPPPMLRQLQAEGLRSLLSAPLMVEGEVIGEINLAASAPAAFDIRASGYRARDRHPAGHRHSARPASAGALSPDR